MDSKFFTNKFQFSIDLAKAINGEIINADSMQVYKGLDNITNKHPMNEREGVTHHVINHVSWDEEYFIHRFATEAQQAIDDIHARNKIPIIVGGTHYYLLKLLFNNKTIGEDEQETKKLTDEQLKVLNGPVETIFSILKQNDPTIAEKFHPQDYRKLRRALEIYYLRGDKVSEIYRKQKDLEFEDSSLKYNLILFWIYSDYEVLKSRLDTRVDNMMINGGLYEIKQMFDQYQTQNPDLTKGVWQVIGFKEFIPWLQSITFEDLKDVKFTPPNDDKLFKQGLERMKIRTRQYAKYQIKWIQKNLLIELQKESRFNYKYGGKLYLLDATDLSQWQQNVNKIGVSICNQFLNNETITYPQVPDHLKSVFPDEVSLESRTSNKKPGSQVNWKHYQCDFCLDKLGKPLIAVGEESWKIHTASRRYKKAIGSIERKRKHQEMIDKKIQQSKDRKLDKEDEIEEISGQLQNQPEEK